MEQLRSKEELNTVYYKMLQLFNKNAKKSGGYYPITFQELQTLEYVLGMIDLKEWHRSIYDLIEKEKKGIT